MCQIAEKRDGIDSTAKRASPSLHHSATLIKRYAMHIIDTQDSLPAIRRRYISSYNERQDVVGDSTLQLILHCQVHRRCRRAATLCKPAEELHETTNIKRIDASSAVPQSREPDNQNLGRMDGSESTRSPHSPTNTIQTAFRREETRESTSMF
jgi:hypothetical protein